MKIEFNLWWLAWAILMVFFAPASCTSHDADKGENIATAIVHHLDPHP